MLQRVPKAKEALAKEALSRRVRQRWCRVRRAKGIVVVPVEVDWRVLDLLIKMGWVAEADARSRERIGRAIAERLAKSARI